MNNEKIKITKKHFLFKIKLFCTYTLYDIVKILFNKKIMTFCVNVLKNLN